MGTAEGYLCEVCRHEFTATEANSYGLLGEVCTPVVCPDHGLVSVNVGLNLVRGEGKSAVLRKQEFPCPECGVLAPRWNGRCCPKCGSDRVSVNAIICWD